MFAQRLDSSVKVVWVHVVLLVIFVISYINLYMQRPKQMIKKVTSTLLPDFMTAHFLEVLQRSDQNFLFTLLHLKSSFINSYCSFSDRSLWFHLRASTDIYLNQASGNNSVNSLSSETCFGKKKCLFLMRGPQDQSPWYSAGSVTILWLWVH